MNLEDNWKPDPAFLKYLTLSLRQISNSAKRSMDEIRIHICGFGNFSANEMIKEVENGSFVGRVFFDYEAPCFEAAKKVDYLLSRKPKS